MPYLEPTYILLKCLLSLQSSQMPDLVKHLSANADSYPNVLCVMSRILATKPHSADVERCVSGNNLLKTSLHSGLNIDTENIYLFIHHNLPPTAAWDPRTSVLKWMKLAHTEWPHDPTTKANTSHISDMCSLRLTVTITPQWQKQTQIRIRLMCPPRVNEWAVS